jgi:hypothetical protein
MKYTFFFFYLDPFHYSGRSVSSLPVLFCIYPLGIKLGPFQLRNIIYKEF